MSNSEIIKQINEKTPNEDSSISSSTNTSFSENIIQEINTLKSKEIYLISKNFETKIPDIFAYLQSDSNSYSNKLLILKYLENIFTKISFNSAILYYKVSNNDKEKLNLLQILINQYVTCPNEKIDYLTELKNIFTLLLSQVTLDKDTYHYIFSFLINYINKCNNNTNINENIPQNQDSNCNLNDQQLSRIIHLLQIYYQSVQTIDEPYNYFYFVNPDKENYINISNKENPKTHKKFFNLDESLNILMHIKLLPSQIIKQIYTDIKYIILDVLFNDKSKNIIIGLDKENYLTTNFTNEKLIKLEDSKVISLLVKIYFKDHVKTDIYINNKKVEISSDNLKNIKNEKKSKDKLEINGIKLFNNFIGICSSILIYKESEKDKKNLGFPNFLVPGKSSDRNLRSIQMNGFYKEELFSVFIKNELENNKDEKNAKESKGHINDKLNENDIKEFYEKNLISIYMPNRFIMPENQSHRTGKISNRIILKDSINNLDAEFNINSLNSNLNGIHTYEKFSDYITPFGGLNQFLPIIEMMTKNEELLFNENLLNFFHLISSIFMPSYNKILQKENNSNFFFNLSYFLEKIPVEYFDNQLACKLNSISLVLIYLGKDYSKIIEQFHHYILMNEKILFKFQYENHVLILQQIKSFIDRSKKEGYNIDINLIINILLHYDKERYTKFCCKYHSEFFNESCEYLSPELNILLKPMEEIIEKLFEKFIEEVGQKEKEQECEIGKKLFKMFELLTIDISPCIQKILINQFYKYMEKHMAKYYAFLDVNKRMLDIILFIFKTSIFDIKIDALNLLLMIPACQKNMSEFYDKRSQTNSFGYEDEPSFIDNEKIILIQNHILPYYLLGEGILVSSSSSKKSNDDSLNNSLDMDKIEDKNKSNNNNIKKFFSSKNQLKLAKNSKKLNKNNFYKRNKNNELDDLDDDDISKAYTFKSKIFKNGAQFNCIKITSIQQKIYLNYKKKKIITLIKELYNNVIKSRKKKEIDFILNLLIKIVSKGDIILIIRFLDDIKKSIENYDIKKIVYKNPLFLHWLLETSFQAYMIGESNFDTEKFHPGFYIDPFDDDSLEGKKIFTEEEKKLKINEIFEKANEFINNIIKENMYNLDYVLTWSKYYYEIRDDKNNYDKVIDFALKILRSSFKLSHEILINDSKINNSQKTSIYYLNILFEFLTFFKMNGEQDDASLFQNSALQYNISKIDEELYNNFPYILYLENKLDEKDIFKTLSIKWKDFPFYEKIYSFFRPMWNIFPEKKTQEETTFFNSFKKYISKKNYLISKLQLLFYSFNDIDELFNPNLTKTHGNKGIKIIYMILHFFILIINIGGNETEVKNIFNDFYLFISLMIISSHTVTISTDTKFQRWPNESQYKEVQDTIYLLFCYTLNFFINKIKESDNFIKKYNGEKNDDGKDLLNYYTYLRQILIENLSYFLKFLSIIYNENKGKKFKSSKSGIYLLSEKLYSILDKKDSDNNNIKNEDENNSEINFFEDISRISIKRDSKEINSEVENYIYLFVNSSKIQKFLSDFLNDKKNKKHLYPFGEYIEKREKLIHSIIPIYRTNAYNTQKNLCLSPDYWQESSYNKILDSKIGKINKELIKEILINQKKISLEENEKIHEYKIIKKQLFSFRGLWSKEEYFYDQKYHLKYKLVNHLSDDFTKVLLRPIFDLDYYLPKYSQFEHENLFRIPENQIPIYYLVDLSFALKESHKSFLKIAQKKEIEETPGNDEKQNNQKKNEENETKNGNENKKENNEINLRKSKKNGKKRTNALFDVKIANYSFYHSANSDMTLEQIFTEPILYAEIIKQKHLSNSTKHDIKVDACLIKTELHISGIFYNNNKEIGFYSLEKSHSNDEEDYDFDRKVCFGSIFRPQENKYNYYYIRIPYDSIEFVLKKRYYFKLSVLEIFTINKKIYSFKFNENELKTIIDNIRYYMKSNIEDIYVENVRNEIGFYNKKKILNNGIQLPNKIKNMNLKYLYEKWTKWEISTLKMLMIINFYANRSFNDINQYPVFPWIITYYNKEEVPNPPDIKIRPLGTPMGMLDFTEEALERKKSFLSTWGLVENKEDDEDFDRYRSHYSTSLYITYYLVRVFPFSSMRIELQGKNFDDPNRLFNSLSESFNCALTQKSDVRELTPEFFYFPEMFYNINKLNLGEIKNRETKIEEPVNDIKMPKWADYDAFIFINKHRMLLESSEVNEKINEWFNIIFGSKQKGSAAKKIGNLFIRQSYENFYETYNKSEKKDKIYFCRMVEFGVTPHQIFKNDTSKRMNYNYLKSKRNTFENITEIIKKNEDKSLEISKEILVEQNNKNADSSPIKLFLLQKNDEEEEKRKIFILKDNGIIKTIKISQQQDQSASNKKILSSKNLNIDLNEDMMNLEKKIVSKKLPKISDSQKDINLFLPKYRMDFKESPNLFFNKGHSIALGGYWNGSILVENISIQNKKDKNKEINTKIYYTKEYSPITHMIMDENETFVICGNNLGTVFIYTMDNDDKTIWYLYKVLYDHFNPITSLAISEKLNIFISCSKYGYCMLYTLPKCKLINSHKLINIINSNSNNGESISNTNLCSDITLISESPLPCIVFYIKSRNTLCVSSINGHFINETKPLYFFIQPNTIKKFTDRHFIDYILLFNPKNESIDIYNIIDLEIVISWQIKNYTFIDFILTKEMDNIFILTKLNLPKEERERENDDKNIYQILVIKTNNEIKMSNEIEENIELPLNEEEEKSTPG